MTPSVTQITFCGLISQLVNSAVNQNVVLAL